MGFIVKGFFCSVVFVGAYFYSCSLPEMIRYPIQILLIIIYPVLIIVLYRKVMFDIITQDLGEQIQKEFNRIGLISTNKLHQFIPRNIHSFFVDNESAVNYYLNKLLKEGTIEKGVLEDKTEYYYYPGKLTKLKEWIQNQMQINVRRSFDAVHFYANGMEDSKIFNGIDFSSFKIQNGNEYASLYEAIYTTARNSYLAKNVKEKKYTSIGNIYFDTARLQSVRERFEACEILTIEDISAEIGNPSPDIPKAFIRALNLSSFYSTQLSIMQFDTNEKPQIVDRKLVWIHHDIATIDFSCTKCKKITQKTIKYGPHFYCEEHLKEFCANTFKEQQENGVVRRYITAPPPGFKIVGQQFITKPKGLDVYLAKCKRPVVDKASSPDEIQWKDFDVSCYGLQLQQNFPTENNETQNMPSALNPSYAFAFFLLLGAFGIGHTAYNYNTFYQSQHPASADSPQQKVLDAKDENASPKNQPQIPSIPQSMKYETFQDEKTGISFAYPSSTTLSKNDPSIIKFNFYDIAEISVGKILAQGTWKVNDINYNITQIEHENYVLETNISSMQKLSDNSCLWYGTSKAGQSFVTKTYFIAEFTDGNSSRYDMTIRFLHPNYTINSDPKVKEVLQYILDSYKIDVPDTKQPQNTGNQGTPANNQSQSSKYKTFSNDAAGYSFEYPKECSLGEMGRQSVHFKLNETVEVSVGINNEANLYSLTNMEQNIRAVRDDSRIYNGRILDMQQISDNSLLWYGKDKWGSNYITKAYFVEDLNEKRIKRYDMTIYCNKPGYEIDSNPKVKESVQHMLQSFKVQ